MAKQKNDLLRAWQDKDVEGSKYSSAQWKNAHGEILRLYLNADN